MDKKEIREIKLLVVPVEKADLIRNMTYHFDDRDGQGPLMQDAGYFWPEEQLKAIALGATMQMGFVVDYDLEYGDSIERIDYCGYYTERLAYTLDRETAEALVKEIKKREGEGYE